MPAYFNEPVILPSVGRVLTTTADVEKWVADVHKDFQQKGYVKFDFEHLTVKLLGKNVALLSYSGKRLTKDGTLD